MAKSGRTFGATELALAAELGRRAAIAVENARLYAERSAIAATLQRSLLPPDLPEIPGFRLASLYRAAGEQNEVGGDFYDAFEAPGGWMVVVGDVAGRGAEAAALTSLSRYTFRTAGKLLGDPIAALERLNAALRERPRLSLVSVCCVMLRVPAATCSAELVLAGHPPAYHLRRGPRAQSACSRRSWARTSWWLGGDHDPARAGDQLSPLHRRGHRHRRRGGAVRRGAPGADVAGRRWRRRRRPADRASLGFVRARHAGRRHRGDRRRTIAAEGAQRWPRSWRWG